MGREALERWLAEPAAMPRMQHEAIVKLLAADFGDDATVLAEHRRRCARASRGTTRGSIR